jgi:hypothetical protein
VGEAVGRDRTRFERESYWVKRSRRRFRVFCASESSSLEGTREDCLGQLNATGVLLQHDDLGFEFREELFYPQTELTHVLR